MAPLTGALDRTAATLALLEARGTWAPPSVRPGGTRCRPHSPGGAGGRAPFSHPAPRLGEASSSRASSRRPVGTRSGGWEKVRASRSQDWAFYALDDSQPSRSSSEGPRCGWGPPLASSLPAPGTRDVDGGGAFNRVPWGGVSVGMCPCLLFWCPEGAWQ